MCVYVLSVLLCSVYVLLCGIFACSVTLLNSYPELQYIVLRNILVIIQKYPSLLAKDVKVVQPQSAVVFSFSDARV